MSVEFDRSFKTEKSGVEIALDVLNVLTKHWPVILAMTILGGGAGLLVTRSTPPVYQATATVEYDPNVIRPLSEKEQNVGNYVGYTDPWESLDTQFKIIASNRVLTRVASDLDLANDPAFTPQVPGRPPPSLEDLAGAIRSRTTVEGIRGTRLFTVKVEHNNPKVARRIAEGVVNAYLALNLEKTVSATAEAVVWLNSQVEHYRSEVDSDEDKLHAFKERNQLPNATVNDSISMVRMEMQAYGEALTKSRMEKEGLQARVSELARFSTMDPTSVLSSQVIQTEFVAALRSQYQAAEQEYRQLLAEGKGENHPMARRAFEKMSLARDTLSTELKNLQRSAEMDLAVVSKREAGEAALYEDSRRRAIDLNMKEIEYHRLDRTREQNEKLYGMLLERMKAADLARMMNVSNVRLLDAPMEPKSPIKPQPSVNLMAGLLAGVSFGLMLAWARQLSDRSLKTPEDVESKVGVTFLGLMPLIESDVNAKPTRRRRYGGSTEKPTGPDRGPQELIVHTHRTGGAAEAARAIRTNLMFMNPDRPPRLMLVTSSVPAEGKTTVACSIAISFAQSGRRTCIIDCDLRKPRLHRVFDRVGDAGVTNVLIGEADVVDVAKPTVVENLYSIPAGALPPNPGDMLHSERFKSFLAELGEHFEHVIIDSPPVVAVTDAAILSRLVDGTIFIARGGATSRDLARRGLRSLADVDAPVLGMVLNAVKNNSAEYRYYHYYRREGYAQQQPPPGDDGSGGGSEGGGSSGAGGERERDAGAPAPIN